MSEDLRVEREGAVATISFQRPEVKNAITPEMNQELAAIFAGLRDDDGVCAVILTGSGDSFSAGADLRALSQPGRLGRSADVGYERVRATGLRIDELMRFPKPVIAAVNGVVAGFALGLAFACDVVLAARSASFAITFSRIGYIPDAGVSYFLPRLIGLHRAKELFFAGGVVDAAEADRIGLVNRVVDDELLPAEAQKLARAISERPPAAVRMGKALLNQAAAADFHTAVELEAQAQGILGTTPEHQDAVRAFAERRKK